MGLWPTKMSCMQSEHARGKVLFYRTAKQKAPAGRLISDDVNGNYSHFIAWQYPNESTSRSLGARQPTSARIIK
jgi:hypothetical protein